MLGAFWVGVAHAHCKGTSRIVTIPPWRMSHASGGQRLEIIPCVVGGQVGLGVFGKNQPVAFGWICRAVRRLHDRRRPVAELVRQTSIRGVRPDGRRTHDGHGVGGSGGSAGGLPIWPVGQQCPGSLPPLGAAAAYRSRRPRYWHAAAAAAWRRGRGYFAVAVLLWAAR